MSTVKLSGLKTFFERLDSLKGTLSKAAFSRKIGISAPLYCQWENGASPSADKVRLISESLGVSSDWLLTGHEEMTPAVVNEDHANYACKIPANCDLPARLDSLQSDLDQMKQKMDAIFDLLGGALRKGLSGDKPPPKDVETKPEQKAG